MNSDVSFQVRWPSGGIPRSLEGQFSHSWWLPHASCAEDFLFGRRLAEISSSCRSAGIFDALFTRSELRRALSHCVDSATSLGGMTQSSTSATQSFRGAPSRPCENAVSSSLSSKGFTRRRTIGPFLWFRAVSRCSNTWCSPAFARSLMNPKVGSGVAPTVWWVRLSLSSLLVPLLSHFRCFH